ncbi:MAG: agmatinase [Myxococcota bacterium]|jgi:agmatinase
MTDIETQPAHYRPSSDGFLGLDEEQAGPPSAARAVVIPFGLESSVSYGTGTALGPQAIIEASHQVELFDERLWGEPALEIGIATLSEFPLSDSISECLTQLEQVVERTLSAGQFPLVLGGEHSVTAGAIRPFARRFDTLSVLHFDAHADLRDGYEGEHYSHAAAIRRVLDHSNVSVVSLGIRNISAEGAAYARANSDRVAIHWARDRHRYDIDAIMGELGDHPVYLTFDLDGFDPSVITATGTPEPGGLMWDDVIPIIERVGQTHRVVGADVVELAPRPGWPASDFAAAKLAYRILTSALVGY